VICVSCKKEKTVDNFQSGLKSCMLCQQSKKNWATQNAARVRATGKAWKTANHEKCRNDIREWRVRNEEHLVTYRKKVYASTREDVLARGKEWRRANVHTDLERKKEWALANPERSSAITRASRASKKTGGKLTADDIMLVWAIFGNQCGYCGIATPLDNREIDHIVPIRVGGRSVVCNIANACRKCNRMKNGRELFSWWTVREFWSQERDYFMRKHMASGIDHCGKDESST
jgi:5-methylcytosine-specific restriction endonuclease McrA